LEKEKKQKVLEDKTEEKIVVRKRSWYISVQQWAMGLGSPRIRGLTPRKAKRFFSSP
jgi:hypothetical protein